eukprot:scaffold33458_cov18-Tisochrysis_lutea.AAC.1
MEPEDCVHVAAGHPSGSDSAHASACGPLPASLSPPLPLPPPATPMLPPPPPPLPTAPSAESLETTGGEGVSKGMRVAESGGLLRGPKGSRGSSGRGKLSSAALEGEGEMERGRSGVGAMSKGSGVGALTGPSNEAGVGPVGGWPGRASAWPGRPLALHSLCTPGAGSESSVLLLPTSPSPLSPPLAPAAAAAAMTAPRCCCCCCCCCCCQCWDTRSAAGPPSTWVPCPTSSSFTE